MKKTSGRIKRFFLRYRWMRDYEKSLNRRAEVEQTLLSVANGKRGHLSRSECRELALKLGVPEEWR